MQDPRKTPYPSHNEIADWAKSFETLAERIGAHFARSEARQRCKSYLRGLLSSVERKNGWQLAEYAGDPTPYGIQHLLGRARWDADAVRTTYSNMSWNTWPTPKGSLSWMKPVFSKKGINPQACNVSTAERPDGLRTAKSVFFSVMSPQKVPR